MQSFIVKEVGEVGIFIFVFKYRTKSLIMESDSVCYGFKTSVLDRRTRFRRLIDQRFVCVLLCRNKGIYLYRN